MHSKPVNGSLYYYMSVRKNGKVTTIYLGSDQKRAEEKECDIKARLGIEKRGRPYKTERNSRFINGNGHGGTRKGALSNSHTRSIVIIPLVFLLLAAIIFFRVEITGFLTGEPMDMEKEIEIQNGLESRLGIQVDSIAVDNGKQNIEFSYQGANVKLSGINPDELTKIEKMPIPEAMLDDRKAVLNTETIILNSLAMESAEITLEKSGPVNAILKCTEFSGNDCLSWERTDIPFIDSGDSITFNVSGFSGYAGAYITIINVQSYPTVGGEWVVEFNTTGVANLTISATNGTTYGTTPPSDLEWLSLKCGMDDVPVTFDGDSVYSENWNCSDTGYQTVRVLTEGAHTQQFAFGDDVQYAHNWAKAGNVYNCSSCSDCNDAIADASEGDIIQLNVSITDVAGTCINVSKSNVIIDGNGYNISGDGSGYGVYISDYNNITIRNFAGINGFYFGIYYMNSLDNLIVNNTILTSSFGRAIVLSNTNQSNLSGNHITTSSSSAYGIELTSSSFNNLNGTVIMTNDMFAYGILLESSSNDNVLSWSNVTTKGFLAHGIDLSSSLNNNLSDNLVETNNNMAYGIYFESLSDNNLLNSSVVRTNGNNSNGIYLNSASNSNISGSNITTYGSQSYGIFISSSSNSYLSGVVVDTNAGTAHGLYISSSSDDLIGDSIVRTNGSGAYGIDIMESPNNTISMSNITTLAADSVYFNGAGCANNTLVNIIFENNNESTQHLKIDTAGINGTTLVDVDVGRYSIAGSGGNINFRKTGFGEINFTSPVNGTGANLSADIFIAFNNASVNSSQTGLNRSALITLFNLPTGMTNPKILRDGVECPASICMNLTSLNAGNVTFNVTGWTSYSVGVYSDIPPVASLGSNPADSIYDSDGLVSFDFKCSDDVAVNTLQLWGNWSGSWSANQTNSAPANDIWWNVSVDGIPEGVWKWGAWCNDSAGQESWSASNRTFTVTTNPANYSNFACDTTDFNSTDVTNVSNAVLEACGQGSIVWSNPVNASGADFNSYINISYNFISVDVAALNLTFNSSATLTLADLPYAKTPVIYRNGGLCAASICSGASYSNGNFSFTVQYFSNYTTGANANLSIWDDTDSQTKYPNQNVTFYANYTNVTSGESINGTGAGCNVSFNATEYGPFVMTFNSTSLQYEYYRTFSAAGVYEWNVSCNGSDVGYEPLNVSDSVNVSQSIGQNITNCSSCSDCNARIASASVGDIIALNVSLTGIAADCINLSKSGVTFDGQGNTLTGTLQAGQKAVATYGISNVTLRNLVIRDFGDSMIACFPGDTPILLANGSTKRIQDIERGDMVSSYDEVTGQSLTSTVRQVIAHPKRNWEAVVINGNVTVTTNHPIFANGGWVEAGELKIGDMLLDSDKYEVPVHSLATAVLDAPVYNLEVSPEGYDGAACVPGKDYYAGGILAHNKLCAFVFSKTGNQTNFEFVTLGVYNQTGNYSSGLVSDRIFKENEGYSYLNLEHQTNEISMLIPPHEVDYLDNVELQVVDSNGSDERVTTLATVNSSADLAKLRSIDGDYFVLSGEPSVDGFTDVNITFERLPDPVQDHQRIVRLVIYGYYDVYPGSSVWHNLAPFNQTKWKEWLAYGDNLQRLRTVVGEAAASHPPKDIPGQHSAIHFEDSTGDTIENVTINSSTTIYDDAIYLYDVNDSVIRNLTILNFTWTIFNGGYGINLVNSSRNNLSNAVLDTTSGVKMSSSNGNNVNNFTFRKDQEVNNFGGGYGYYYAFLLDHSLNNSFSNINITDVTVPIDIAAINNYQDIYYANLDDPIYCNNDFTNITSDSGGEVLVVRNPAAVQNKNFSQLVVCNATGLTISNIIITNVHQKKNGMLLYFVSNATVSNIQTNFTYTSEFHNLSGVRIDSFTTTNGFSGLNVYGQHVNITNFLVLNGSEGLSMISSSDLSAINITTVGGSVTFDSSTNSSLLSTYITGNGRIYLYESDNISVRNSLVNNGYVGLFSTTRSNFTNTTAICYTNCLYLNWYCSNNSFYNTNLTTFNSGASGVYAYYNSSYNRFENTFFTTYGDTAPAIYLESWSIGDSFLNTTIRTNGSQSHGIKLFAGLNSNIFSGLNITTTGSNAHGIYMDSSNNNIFSGLNITANASQAYGVFIASSNDNNISGMNISTKDTSINLASSLRNIFRNGFLNTRANNSIAIYSGSTNTTIWNVNIDNTNASARQLWMASGVNGTTLVDANIGSYLLSSGGGKMNFRKTGIGEINFTQAIKGNGSNLSADVYIAFNNASVNSSQTGLNKSAVIKLFNLPTGMNSPKIVRDRAQCPAGICTNLTNLNAGNVSFNVTGWTDYSVQDLGCGRTLTGSFTLTENLTGSGTCFTAGANDIVIDGNGFTITGDGTGYGVNISGFNNVTVKNFAGINNFTYGVSLNGSVNSTLFNNSILTTIASGNGVYIVNNTQTVITNNNVSTIGSSAHGFFLNSSSNINIANCTSNTNGTNAYGFYIIESTYSNISGIKANTELAGSYGFFFDNSSNNIITTSIANTKGSGMNAAHGFFLFNSFYNSLEECTANINGTGSIVYPHGIRLRGSSYNNISNCIANTQGSSEKGFELWESANNNILTNNTVNTNGFRSYGIFIMSSANNNIINECTIITNGIEADGIYLDSLSTNNILIGNNVTTIGSKAYGIYIEFNSTNNSFTSGSLNTLAADSIRLDSWSENNIFEGVNISNFNESTVHLNINAAGIDGITLIDMDVGPYFINGTGGTMNFRKTGLGEINFTAPVNGSGSNLSADVQIGSGWAYVNSSSNNGLNGSANIVLYNMPQNFVYPLVLKDGQPCPANICSNSTSLNSAIVAFNVTGWSNYTIANGTQCGYFNANLTLWNNITVNGTCFTVNASSVSIDGAGFAITGDGSGYGLNISGFQNVTISNFAGINNFSNGIYNINSLNISIFNNSVQTWVANGYGISLVNTSQSNITSNNVATNGSFAYGFFLSASTFNNITSATANTNGSNSYGFFLDSASDNNIIISVRANTNGSNGRGFWLSSSFNNNITNATANTNGNGGYGFYSSSASNTITNSASYTNNTGAHGFFFVTSANNNFSTVTANTKGDGAIGFYLKNSANDNNITNSTAITNSSNANGFYIENSANNTIMGSTANTNGSGAYGIYLLSSFNNTVSGGSISTLKANSIHLFGASSENNTFQNVTIVNTNTSTQHLNVNTEGINGTTLIDMDVDRYTIAGGKVNFRNTGIGEINFIQPINGSGANLSDDVQIAFNYTFVNSTGNPGLNRSANITLYGMTQNFQKPVILRNGAACPAGTCTNYTSLNAENVTFSVSYWTNYSIGENPDYPPVASIGTNPVDSIYDSDGTVTFDLKCSDDAGVDTLQVWGNWTGSWSANATNSTPTNDAWWNVTVGGIPEGVWKWGAWCNDSAGNGNWSALNRTFWVDLTNPVPTIVVPANVTYAADPQLNFSYSESNPDSCLYSLNGVANVTLASCDTNGSILASNEGGNGVRFCMNDTSGRQGCAQVYYTMDSTGPQFSNYARTPSTPNEDEPFEANVTISEYADAVILELDNGTKTNYSVTTNASLEYYFNAGIGNYSAHDAINYSWFANDTLGNGNWSAQQSFIVANQLPSVSQPSVNDTAPKTEDFISCDSGAFSDNDAEDSEQGREYRWYDGDEQVSGQTGQTLSLAVPGLDKGDAVKCSVRVYDGYDWSAWANSSNTATIQNTAPTIPLLSSPGNGTLTSDSTPFLNWTASTDADGDAVTYALEISDDASFGYANQSDYSLALNNFTASALNDAVYYWRVKALTADANSSWSGVYNFTVDATKPAINVQSPVNASYSSGNMWFNATVSEEASACFVDYGYGNHSLTNSSGNWNYQNASMNEGTYQAAFYCNDTAGNWNFTSIYFTVDLTNPSALMGTNPVNYANDSDGSLTFDMKCFDNTAVNTLQLWGNWSGGWAINATNSTPVNDSYWNVTVNGIPDGVWKWAAWCNDSAGNWNSTANRTIAVMRYYQPVINISLTYPTESINVYYGRWFNVTANVSCIQGSCGEINVSLDPAPSGIPITNCTELQDMKNNLSSDFYLANDINCSETVYWNYNASLGVYFGFEPVGNGSIPYNGTFDGQGFTISGIFTNRTGWGTGLFGYTQSANIKNIKIWNATIIGGNGVGGVVGYATLTNFTEVTFNGTIIASGSGGGIAGYVQGTTTSSVMASGTVLCTGSNCAGLFGDTYDCSISYSHANATVNAPWYAGGLIGYARGNVTRCSASGSVNGSYGTGGLVGRTIGLLITQSYATGNITGVDYVGGLVGLLYWNSAIYNSYASGDVAGVYDVGGLVGGNYGQAGNYTYSTGKVTGNTTVGGLYGNNDPEWSPANFSYWDVQTSGQNTSNGGAGKNTTEMQQQATYLGWDFNNVWFIDENVSYPRLVWTQLSGGLMPKGLIPENNGIPFYTNRTNPSTVNLSAGESQLMIWYVNATRGWGTYRFFADANLTSNASVSARTGEVNVTILYAPSATVSLLAPMQYYYQSDTGNTTFNFSCEATTLDVPGLALINITLWVWNETGAQLVQNATVASGSYSAANFTQTVPTGTARYTWNCIATTSWEQNTSAVENHSLNIGGVYECMPLTIPNERYGLKKNLTTMENCITITAENVTLDLEGHNITGDSDSMWTTYSRGVWVQGNRSIVTNGTIAGFFYGIPVDSENSTVERLRLTNVETSLYIGGANNIVNDINATLQHAMTFSGTNQTGTNLNLYQSYDGCVIYADNSTFTGINATDSNGHGVDLHGDNNVLRRIYITHTHDYPLEVQGAHNNLIENLTISASMDDSYSGLNFQSCSQNNTVRGATITTSYWGAAVDYCYQAYSADLRLENVVFGSGVQRTMEIGWNGGSTSGGVSNITLVNVTSGAGMYQMYQNDCKNHTLINVTLGGAEGVSSGSELFRSWFYRAFVNDTNGNPVAGANVAVYNASAANVFNLTTNASGWTGIATIKDYSNLGGAKYYDSPYTIIASNGSSNMTRIYNVTAQLNNLRHFFTLGVDIDKPVVNLYSPPNGFHASAPNPYFVANFTDNMGLDNATLFVWNSTGDAINQTFQNISGINASANVSVTLPYEDAYWWNYFACDAFQNCDWSASNRTLVFDATYPKADFIPNTIANGGTTNNVSVNINVSISEKYLNEIKLRWNGTNTTLYNNSLVLLMNFDNLSVFGEGTNSNLTFDASNFNNSGNCTNMSTGCSWTDGKYGKALSFDGFNDYVTLGSKFNLNTPYTISAWIWVNKFTNDSAIMFDGDGSSFRYNFAVYEDGKVGFSGQTSGNWAGRAINKTNATLSVGQWYHVLVTRNGAKGSNATFYVNGAPDNTFADSHYDSSAGPFYIGKAYISNYSYFNGTIDDLRIWNRSMTAQEAYEQYAANLNRFNVTQWYLAVNQSANSTFGLAEGAYSYSVFAKDVAGNNNGTSVRTVTVDFTNPTASIGTNPADSSSFGNVSLPFDLKCSDNFAIGSLQLWGDWSGAWAAYQTNSTPSNDIWWNVSISGIPNGTWKWTAWCNDSAGNGNWSSVNRTFNIDSVAPAITINDPANGTITSDVFDFEFSEEIDTALYSVDGGSNVTNSSLNQTWAGSLPSLSDGQHNVTVWANDTTGNANSSMRFWVRDTTPPFVAVQSPGNESYDTPELWFNATASADADSCIVNYGFGNKTMTNSTGNWNHINASMQDGTYQAVFYCNDSIGNFNSSGIFFTIDTTPPVIWVQSPQNQTYWYANIWFNATASEPADVCLVDFGYGNFTMSNSTGNWNYENDSMGDGNYTAEFYCNDTIGNSNRTSVTFAINTSLPSVVINAPAAGATNSDGFAFSYGGADCSWYSLDGAENVTNCSITGDQWSGEFAGLTDGPHNVTVWANNSLGLSGFDTGAWNRDTNAPPIYVASPGNVTYATAIFSINVSSDGTESGWRYSLNGAGNQTFLPNTTGTAAESGNNIMIYVNDSAGNWNSTSVYFTVDTIDPMIFIGSPAATVYAVDPQLNFSFSEANPDTCWYSINGTGNVTLSSCITNGTILPSGEGQNNVTLCMNDSAGRVGCDFVAYSKDSIPPEITVYSPLNASYQSLVVFNVSLDEPGNTCLADWGDGNNTMNPSGSNALWNLTNSSMPDSNYLVRFFCNDTLGNGNTTGVYFTVDTIKPIITVQSPQSQNYSTTSMWFNVTLNEAGDTCLADCWNYNSSNRTMTNSSGNWNYYNDTMPDGIYPCRFYCNDTAGNLNATNLFYFGIDITPPVITISNPPNATVNNDSFYFSFNGMANCSWYSLDEGENVSNCSTFYWSGTFDGLSDGPHNVMVWANDSAGNVNSTSRSWTRDTTAPPIFILLPQNVSYVWTPESINVTSDGTEEGWKYSLNGEANVTFAPNISISRPEGSYKLTVYVNDSAGNWNSSVVYFTIDLGNPVSYLGTNPPNNFTDSDGSVSFDLKCSDGAAVSTLQLWGNWSGAWAMNQTNSAPLNDTWWNVTVAGIPEGVWKWGATCNDSANRSAIQTENRTLKVDLYGPALGDRYINRSGKAGPNSIVCINVSGVSDMNLQSVWATITQSDGNVFNATMYDTGSCAGSSGDGWFSVPVNAGNSPGTFWYNATYANDSFGRVSVNGTPLQLEVDVSPPDISILSPLNATYNAYSMWFNLTAGPDADACIAQYGFSSDIGQNHTMTNASGNWNHFNASLTQFTYYRAKFYCNDTVGNLNSTDWVYFTVDTVPPAVNIVIPLNATTNNDSFYFNYSEVNCSWYSLDDEPNVTNCSVYPLNYWAGFFAGLTDGPHNLTVWVNDSYGNANSITRYWIRDTSPPNITISSPVNATYTSYTMYLNVTANEALSECVYKIVPGGNNSMTNSSAFNWSAVISPSDGSHNLYVFCNDTARNLGINSSIWFTKDTLPYWTGNQTNTPAAYSESQQSCFNVTWQDGISGIDTVFIEGGWSGSVINYTASNFSSTQFYYCDVLPAGTFFWVSWANDSFGRLNVSNSWTFTISRAPNPVSLFLNGSQSDVWTTYGNVTNATGYSAYGTPNLYRNGQSTSNPEVLILGAGTHDYVLNTTGDQNHTANSSTLRLTVIAAPSATSLFLNSAQANLTINYSQIANVSAYCDIGTPTMFKNSSQVSSPFIWNPAAGTYLFSANCSGDSNHSVSEKRYLLAVNKAVSSVTMLLNGTDGDFQAERGSWVNLTAFLNHDQTQNFNMYQNYSMVKYGFTPLENLSYYPVSGHYDITANCSASENYSSASVHHLLVIADTIPPSLDFTPPTPDNGTNSTRNWIYVNVSAGEVLGGCVLSWFNGSLLNLSMNYSGTNCYKNMTGLGEGGYRFRVFGNDTDGNVNATPEIQVSLNFSIDLVAPALDFVSPTLGNGSTTTNSWIAVNVSANEDLGACVLNWNNGTITNVSMSVNGTSCYALMQGLSQGYYYFKVFANDTAGNMNATGGWQIRYYIAPSQPPSGGGPSGGGAIPSTPPKANATIVAESIEIITGTRFIYLEMYPGDTTSTSIFVKNNQKLGSIFTTQFVGNAKDFVTFLGPSFAYLMPGSGEYHKIQVSIPGDAKQGIYSGEVSASGGGVTDKIPVTIKVLEKKQGLLDLKIEALKTSVRPGDSGSYEIKLYNLGKTGRVDVQLKLQVYNPKTNETIAEKVETLAVETSLSALSELAIPANAKDGSYEVRATAFYTDSSFQAAQAYATTQITVRGVHSPWYYDFATRYWYALVLMLIGIIVAYLYLMGYMSGHKG